MVTSVVIAEEPVATKRPPALEAMLSLRVESDSVIVPTSKIPPPAPAELPATVQSVRVTSPPSL
jgi:hypothetical protein